MKFAALTVLLSLSVAGSSIPTTPTAQPSTTTPSSTLTENFKVNLVTTTKEVINPNDNSTAPLNNLSTDPANSMYVVKRSGKKEPIFYDKIQTRINQLTAGLDSEYVDIARISQKVVSGIYPGVKTSELDTLAAETSAYMSTVHPDYGRLAARISVSNLQKETMGSFSRTIGKLADRYEGYLASERSGRATLRASAGAPWDPSNSLKLPRRFANIRNCRLVAERICS